MNPVLEKFARDWLCTELPKLPEGSQVMFKRMYAQWSANVARTGVAPTKEMLAMPISDVVKEMDTEKLDLAMRQVINSR